jgi:hypothetical protein
MIPNINDHMSNIYNLYGHRIKNPNIRLNRNKNGQNPLKNIERYYEYYNINTKDNKGRGMVLNNIIPNKKLSPMRNIVI